MKKILILFLSIIFFLFAEKTYAVSGSLPVQGSSQYVTPSDQAPSDGSSTETITITLKDINQNPVVGDVITLSSSNDVTAKFPKNDQSTDTNGNATFTVTTTTPGNVKITLFDSTNNVTFTDWFTVTFYDVTKGCKTNPPSPTLTSVVSKANGIVTLTWVAVTDPVSNYLVSYGVESGKYIYGNANVGPQGTTNYTVGSLAADKKYYFVVAANNNCGTSGFSKELSAFANPISATLPPTTISTTKPTVTSTPYIPIATSAIVLPNEVSEIAIETPTPLVATQNLNTTFRNIAIIIIGIGVLLIGAVVLIQRQQDKTRRQL